MSSEAQYAITELLEQAGARPRGNRHDCPRCDGQRTLTHTEECFFCHKCQWKGNTITLAKELGVSQRLSPEEYRELCRRREEAKRLYLIVKAQRMTRLDELRTSNLLETLAHHAGPGHLATWEALAMVYREKPRLLAELTFLESARAPQLQRFFGATSEQQRAVLSAICEHGGMLDFAGKFVEVNL